MAGLRDLFLIARAVIFPEPEDVGDASGVWRYAAELALDERLKVRRAGRAERQARARQREADKVHERFANDRLRNSMVAV